MYILGIIILFEDWTRRIYLEDICLMEDRLDYRRNIV